MSLPDRVKMAYIGQSLRPQILPQSDPRPCWFERRRHSMANCGRMVTDSATVTMESIWETSIALPNSTIVDPVRPPLPPKWGPKCTQEYQIRNACCHLANMTNISTRQLCAVPDVIMSQAMSPFAKLFWLFLWNLFGCHWLARSYLLSSLVTGNEGHVTGCSDATLSQWRRSSLRYLKCFFGRIVVNRWETPSIPTMSTLLQLENIH